MTFEPSLVEKAQNIFREIFEKPELKIFNDMKASDVDNWDSLNHISLIMRLEEDFKVRFNTREVMGWKNVGEMLQSLSTRVSEKK